MTVSEQTDLNPIKCPYAVARRKAFWLLKQSPLTLIGGAIMALMLLLMLFSPG